MTHHTPEVCPYFKKKKEIEAKLGITEEEKPDATIMFSVDKPDGFTVEDTAHNAEEDGSGLENSVALEECDGVLVGGVDKKEDNVTNDGTK